MLQTDELLTLLGDLESDRVERTRSLDDTSKFCEAVCAFANDFPHHRKAGYLLIGVDNDGSISGLRIGDEVLRGLGGIRSDGNIQPLPAITIELHSFPEGDVAVVSVLPSNLPPVRYKGRVWIRVGPRRAIASEQEEKLLSERRTSLTRSFDASPCQGSSLDDLSLQLFSEYRGSAVAPEVIKENHRSIEEQLSSLRFFDIQERCPSHAGILLFGKDPRYFLPGAYVQYLSLPSDSLSELPNDQAELSGDLASVLRELELRIRTNLRKSLVDRSELRQDLVHDYPEVAIKEFLNNAIMHRDYQSTTPIRFYWFADRIEIISPGGLFGEVTKETMDRLTSYRNPTIAEAMKVLGYVNRFGSGILRAQKRLVENGNGEAQIEVDQYSVAIKILGKQP